MPVVDRAKERAIVERALQRGMSQDQIKQAVTAFRAQSGGVPQAASATQQAAPQQALPDKYKIASPAGIDYGRNALLSSEEQQSADAKVNTLNQGAYNKFQAEKEKEANPGLVKSIIQGVASPFLHTATNVANFVDSTGKLLQGDVKGAQQAVKQTRDYGYFGKDVAPVGFGQDGKVKNFGGFAGDVIGTGAEIASYAAPLAAGAGSKVVKGGEVLSNMTKNVAKPTIASFAKGGALAGSLGSAGASLREGKDVGDVIKSGVTGGLLGGVLGGAVPAVGRGISSIAKAGKEGVGTAGRFASSQLTRLNPETAALARAGKISNEALKTAPGDMANDLVSRVQNAFDDRFSKLRETGAEYEGIRNQGILQDGSGILANGVDRHTSGLPKFVTDTLQNKFGILVDDAGKLSTNQYSRVTDADLSGIQKILDQYGKSPSLDANVVLNTRQALDSVANWDGMYNDSADRVAKALRSEYDKHAKSALPGLANLDAKFAPEKEFIDEIRKALYESPQKQKSGEVRASAYSDISNLLSTAKINKRTRIEKLVPGITEEVRVLKALQDVAHAEGQKVGTYLASGVGLSSLLSGNPAIAAAGILYAIFGTPKNFVKLLRQVGRAEKFGSLIVENTIQKILKGQKLGDKSLQLIRSTITAAQRAGVIEQSTQ